MRHTALKKKFTQDSVIQRLIIYFTNGDYLTIRHSEICKPSFDLYNRLILKDREYYAVGHSGFIKLRIQPGKAKGEERALHNHSEYVKNRKAYIENRLTSEDTIDYIEIYNELNWHDSIYGDIYATLEGEYLYLHFKENEKYGSFSSDYHYIDLEEPSIKMISSIKLDFENCDGIEVYNDEIKELNLEYEEKLVWNSSGYIRSLKQGYMIIDFNNSHKNRDVNILSFYGNNKTTLMNIKRRICGREISYIDICNLYVYFEYNLNSKGTIINVPEIKKYVDNDANEKDSEYGELYGYHPHHYYDDYDYDDEDEDNEDDEWNESYYESGYAKKLKDGSIIIIFGKKQPEKE